MDTPRDDLIALLKSMNITLPPKTKLPDNELEKRLGKALDLAQEIALVTRDQTALDPSSLSKWASSAGTIKVFEAIRRNNMGEANKVFRAGGSADAFPLYENPFMDVRQTLMSLANAVDQGMDTAAVNDADPKMPGVYIRIVDVMRFNNQTPVIVVLYRLGVIDSTMPDLYLWLNGQHIRRESQAMPRITSTLQERRLLLRLLRANSKRLSKSYKMKREEHEQKFTLSFLLPVGPLHAKDIASLCRNNGCSMCGEVANRRCSRCQAAWSCSTECQVDDWKSHKAACKALNGATWKPLSIRPSQDPQYKYMAFINQYTSPQRDQNEIMNYSEVTQEPPPNVHGSKPFVIKMQLSSTTPSAMAMPWEALGNSKDMAAHGTTLLIYDRQRSFQVQVIRKGIGESFDDFAELVQQKGPKGIKLFCWATRKNDWELDICMDALPEWQEW